MASSGATNVPTGVRTVSSSDLAVAGGAGQLALSGAVITLDANRIDVFVSSTVDVTVALRFTSGPRSIAVDATLGNALANTGTSFSFTGAIGESMRVLITNLGGVAAVVQLWAVARP
jgi:hypothetical protein